MWNNKVNLLKILHCITPMNRETLVAYKKIYAEVAKKMKTRQVDVGRLHYALPLMYAVWQAECVGVERISAVEFGVADGQGLMDICKAAEFLQAERGVEVEVCGFDSLNGLPKCRDFRDHPEIWFEGEFATADPMALQEKLPANARLVTGDIADTVKPFLSELTTAAPLGFVSVDVDLYSSTKPALEVLLGHAEQYLPAVSMHINDVEALLTFNSQCGEELAIHEFNDSCTHRRIEKKLFNINRFYVCHVFDHPMRTGAQQPRIHMEICEV